MGTRTAHPDTTFVNWFGIKRKASDDWFDVKLHTDTDLFFDPFLAFDDKSGPWAATEDRLIEFFNHALEHVAKSGGRKSSTAWRQAAAMFSFPEPPEFCLGFGQSTIFGSGSGAKLGRAMLASAEAAVKAGIRDIDDFGDLLLFGEHFGQDRISDMVCNIMKDTFVRYTASVARRHGLATSTLTLQHASYDFVRERWKSPRVELPVNPCWRRGAREVGVLLVPERFLAELPDLDNNQFWDWVYVNQNEQLRKDLGFTIAQGVDRKKIIASAKRSPNLVRKYGIRYAAAKKAKPQKPYDTAADPKFKIKGFDAAQRVAAEAKVDPPASETDLPSFVESLVSEFKRLIEDRGLWKNLWGGGVPFDESRAQGIFHASALRISEQAGIEVSPESNAGSGPVDFKFVQSPTSKVLVELKFAKSSSFWDNLEMQTPTYMKTENTKCGFIVVVQHYPNDLRPEFVDRAKELVARVSKDSNIDYRIVFVDASQRPSASKRKPSRS